MQNSKVHFKEKKHQDLSNASITIKKKTLNKKETILYVFPEFLFLKHLCIFISKADFTEKTTDRGFPFRFTPPNDCNNQR